MLIKIPEIKSSEIDGFSPEIDIFKRKQLGEELSNLLESTDENLIIGIDGQWGEGKSIFSRMLSAHLSNTKSIPTIYFDAFENDYQKDPFIAIASEIQKLIADASPELKKEFKKSAIKVSKAITRGALRVGIKTLTAGILDDSILSDLGTSDDASSEISEGIDKVLAQKLEQVEADKESLLSFRSTLESHVVSIGAGKPVVFIIDELDRCRPDFCLELIEQIKHLFTVKNLKFLLVTNKTQVCASIQKRYGLGINSHIYLQKFVDFWISLPRVESQYASHTKIFLNHLIKKTTTPDEKIKNQLSLDILNDIFCSNKTSYRGMQKTLSYFALVNNSSDRGYIDHYQALLAIACYSKAEAPAISEMILNKKSLQGIKEILFPTDTPINFRTQDFTCSIIKYSVSDEETQHQMIKDQEIRSDFGRVISDDAFQSIINKLNLYST